MNKFDSLLTPFFRQLPAGKDPAQPGPHANAGRFHETVVLAHGPRRPLLGAVYQARAVWHTTPAGDTLSRAIQLLAVDIFYDTPLNPATGTAFTAYGGYYRYDFGPGYLKNAGAMNPANGVRAGAGAFNGPGNNYPMLGTGNILYAQSAYLCKKGLLGDYGTLKPYAAMQWARYERLADPMYLLNAGVNWLIYGNNGKFTLNYESRPVFTAQAAGDFAATGRRGEYVLQYQVAF